MPQRQIDTWIQNNLFNEVPVCICVIDRNFRIVKANRLFELTYGQWCGRSCYQVYKGLEARCERCAAAASFADGSVRVREEEGTVNSGAHHYLVHIVPIVPPDGMVRYIIEMSTDITPVKRLAEQKREADRLAAVGETVAGIAHGIKNVLMGVEGGMYGLRTGIERADSTRIAQGWKMLDENIRRISRFVKEFLEFARGRSVDVAMVDPGAPARMVVDQFRERAAQAGVRLAVDISAGIRPALLDQEGIRTCLENLVSNAVDACRMSDEPREYVVTVSLCEREGALLYEVSDNGCGIDYELSKSIFTRFFSSKSIEEGTGLGLLTTKKIVHQHGGSVSFESTKGQGSCFRIELPRRISDEAGPSDAFFPGAEIEDDEPG